MYREAFANINENVNLDDIDDKDLTFEDWEKNIDEFADNAEYPAYLNQRPFTEAESILEEERIRREKMKEPMTAEQESAQSNIGLSVEEENERALKLGLLHSKIDAFNAALPLPLVFSHTTEAGGSSSIPDSTTGINTDLVAYDNPSVSPTNIEMTNASATGEEEEEDPMDTDDSQLMSMEEMELRERA